MTPRRLALSLGALCALLAPNTHADTTLSGVCPDGSFFVVQSRESVPCDNPHFAAPDQLPPPSELGNTRLGTMPYGVYGPDCTIVS